LSSLIPFQATRQSDELLSGATKKDLTNLARELAKLKEEMRATRLKADPLASPTADIAVPPAPASAAPAKPAPVAPVKVSPPPGPPKPATQCYPSVKKRGQFAVPDGIIAQLRRKCGGNVHDHHVVDVTCGSFAKETQGVTPHSGAFENNDDLAAKIAADLDARSVFFSAYRGNWEHIAHTRNNWVYYDFKERLSSPLELLG
jgi:hypothetical protein